MIKILKIKVSTQSIKVKIEEIYFLVEVREPNIGEKYITVNNEEYTLLWMYQRGGVNNKLVDGMVKTRRKRRGVD